MDLLWTGPLCLIWATITMLPAILANIGKYHSISNFAYKPQYKLQFMAGFIGVGIWQIIFINAAAASLGVPAAAWAAFFFTLGSIGFMFLAFEPLTTKLPHYLCATLYFICSAISAAIFAWVLQDYTWFSFLTIGLCAAFVLRGIVIIVFKRKIYYLELIHILLSYPWIIGLFLLLMYN